MGKKGGGGPSNKTSTPSSGKRQSRAANKALRRIKMKIARWERYKAEEKKPAKGSRRIGWDTSGLKKHAEFLKSLI